MPKKYLKGHLLIASELLVDPNFAKSVVLIFDHNDDGAAGVVLNRPIEKCIADISEEVLEVRSQWKKFIHVGGPVPGPLAVAHTIKEMADLEVMPGVYGSIAPDHLRTLIRKQQEPTLFLVNYSGWGAGQLESELEEDSWHVLPARAEHLFWTRDKDIWSACMAEISGQKIDAALGIKIKPYDPRHN